MFICIPAVDGQSGGKPAGYLDFHCVQNRFHKCWDKSLTVGGEKEIDLVSSADVANRVSGV